MKKKRKEKKIEVNDILLVKFVPVLSMSYVGINVSLNTFGN